MKNEDNWEALKEKTDELIRDMEIKTKCKRHQPGSNDYDGIMQKSQKRQ
ncbi:hypothetical protein [Methylophilus sp.]|nr:hypothetical protein [Methylophilus sp.]